MRKPFMAVFGLMISPDFSKLIPGRSPPPRVNHSQVDFHRLLVALKEMFPFGPALGMKVPNDSIDQVTVHVRLGAVALPGMQAAASKGSAECEDFGALFIKAAKASKDESAGVIDVRKAWSSHHCLPDRDFAPPPVLLAFLVETTDFEDAMIWMSSARVSLGLESLAEHAAMGTPPEETPMEGELPLAFRKELQAVFGCPFESCAVLMRIALSSTPAYAK